MGVPGAPPGATTTTDRLAGHAAATVAGIIVFVGGLLPPAVASWLATDGSALAGPALIVTLLGLGVAPLLVARLPAHDDPRSRFVVGGLIALALVGQASLWRSPPRLSDDTARYIHEGRASRMGLATPYTTSPANLRPPPDDGTSARVNHPTIAAAYFPGAQWILMVTVAVGDALPALFPILAPISHPLLPWRVTLLAVEALALWALWRRRRRRTALSLAMHPLVWLEAGLEAHLDGLAPWLLVGVVLHLAARPMTRWATLSSATLGALLLHIKPVALLAGPFVPRWLRWWAVGAAVVVAGPHLVAGVRVPPGLTSYSTQWRAAPLLFAPLETAAQAVGARLQAPDRYTHLHFQTGAVWIETAGVDVVAVGRRLPDKNGGATILLNAGLAARGMALLLLVAGIGLWWRAARNRVRPSTSTPARQDGGDLAADVAGDVPGDIAVAMGLWLALTTTLHPWYGLWLLVGVLSRRPVVVSVAWAAAAALPLLHVSSHALAVEGTWREPVWPRLVVVIAAVGGGLWGLRRERRRRRLAASADATTPAAPSPTLPAT